MTLSRVAISQIQSFFWQVFQTPMGRSRDPTRYLSGSLQSSHSLIHTALLYGSEKWVL